MVLASRLFSCSGFCREIRTNIGHAIPFHGIVNISKPKEAGGLGIIPTRLRNTAIYIYIYILMNRWLHISGKPYILEKRNGYFGNEMAN